MIDKASAMQALFTNRLTFRAMLWKQLPLAAFAGLRIVRLDEAGCEVALPGGWKTQNPFRSTYFAAQAMAAEMSTGAPALWCIERSGARVSSLVTALEARFTQKATEETRFVFEQGAGLKQAVERAVASGEPVVFAARSIGTTRDGKQVAHFDITWSFKKKR